MQVKSFKIIIASAILASFPIMATQGFAAQPVNLSKQSREATSAMFVSGAKMSSAHSPQFKELRRTTDFNNVSHIRIQQMYQGHRVLGADVVAHVKDAAANVALSHLAHAKASFKMNGTIYKDLEKDLAVISRHALTEEQAAKAIRTATNDFAQKVQFKPTINKQHAEKVVFINDQNKARWAYLVSFYSPEANESEMPNDMRYIIDAASMEVYAKWNEIKNLEPAKILRPTFAGGFGGNVKMGKLIYDGMSEDLSKLSIMRDDENKICYLKNSQVIVKKYNSDWDLASKPYRFDCESTSEEHDNLYWDADLGGVNDGYSPANDALFNGGVVKNLYKDWYDADVLVDSEGKPLTLNMVVNKPRYDNAFWSSSTATMTFGDGYTTFYPLTSLGVTAHEVSHGYTSQNSDLQYYGQSGGMNEAFSDMAAQAAEFYAYGKNSWEIGPEIFKKEGRALRYMEQPSKDCRGEEPGNWCSIDHVDQYYSGLNVHYSSGIYNRAFFLLGTAEGWSVQKAFNVMVKANRDYWTSRSTFNEGACGVLAATADYGYDAKAVYNAFETVGVDTSDC